MHAFFTDIYGMHRIRCMYISNRQYKLSGLHQYELYMYHYQNMIIHSFTSMHGIIINTLSFSTDDKLQKEVWRFRLNWLYTTVAAVLLSISEIAVSSSFHQFVTNPRSNSNGTLSEVRKCPVIYNLSSSGHCMPSYYVPYTIV